jgi:hypothetical protein
MRGSKLGDRTVDLLYPIIDYSDTIMEIEYEKE